MKIRIKGNSLRYRLTKSDIARLGTEGYLEEYTQFLSGTLIYAISVTNDDQLSSDFAGNKILLSMPKNMLNQLIETEKVGFEDQNGPVSLLVEKDFVCLDNVDEDQSDNFPNPQLYCNS